MDILLLLSIFWFMVYTDVSLNSRIISSGTISDAHFTPGLYVVEVSIHSISDFPSYLIHHNAYVVLFENEEEFNEVLRFSTVLSKYEKRDKYSISFPRTGGLDVLVKTIKNIESEVLQSLGVENVHSYAEREEFSCFVPNELVFNELLNLVEVVYITNKEYIKPANFIMGKLVGSGDESAMQMDLWEHGLTGKGQIVGLSDSGLQTSNCLFYDPEVDVTRNLRLEGHRKLSYYQVYDDDAEEDSSGHGTYVAGTIAGKCVDSSQPICEYNGIAYDAKLFIQHQPSESNDWTLDFEKPFSQGVRIHANPYGVDLGFTCNSCPGSCVMSRDLSGYVQGEDASSYCIDVLGSPCCFIRGKYGASNVAIDTFLYNHPEFLIVFSAGNEGQTGPLDVGSVLGGCSAKNSLCVGSSRSTHSQIEASAEMTDFSEYYQNQGWVPVSEYSDPAQCCVDIVGMQDTCCSATVAANYGSEYDKLYMSSFSSHGPVSPTDMRLKPEVVAPGEGIISARSNLNPFDNEYYCSMDSPTFHGDVAALEARSGTSVSTGVVSGAAALIRQYFIDGHYSGERVEPSGMLLKAMLVNSAQQIVSNYQVTSPSPDDVGRGSGLWGVGSGCDDAVCSFVDGFGSVHGLGEQLFSENSRIYVRDYLHFKPNVNEVQAHTMCFIRSDSNAEIEIHAAMTYFDYPSSLDSSGGDVLVNHVNLRLSVTPPMSPGTVIYGNTQSASQPDTINPTEKIKFIESSVSEIGTVFCVNVEAPAMGVVYEQYAAVVIRIVHQVDDLEVYCGEGCNSTDIGGECYCEDAGLIWSDFSCISTSECENVVSNGQCLSDSACNTETHAMYIDEEEEGVVRCEEFFWVSDIPNNERIINVNRPVTFVPPAGLPTHYTWHFGDMQSSSNENIHQYEVPGDLQVTLEYLNHLGETAYVTKTISVLQCASGCVFGWCTQWGDCECSGTNYEDSELCDCDCERNRCPDDLNPFPDHELHTIISGVSGSERRQEDEEEEGEGLMVISVCVNDYWGVAADTQNRLWMWGSAEDNDYFLTDLSYEEMKHIEDLDFILARKVVCTKSSIFVLGHNDIVYAMGRNRYHEIEGNVARTSFVEVLSDVHDISASYTSFYASLNDFTAVAIGGNTKGCLGVGMDVLIDDSGGAFYEIDVISPPSSAVKPEILAFKNGVVLRFIFYEFDAVLGINVKTVKLYYAGESHPNTGNDETSAVEIDVSAFPFSSIDHISRLNDAGSCLVIVSGESIFTAGPVGCGQDIGPMHPVLKNSNFPEELSVLGYGDYEFEKIYSLSCQWSCFLVTERGLYVSGHPVDFVSSESNCQQNGNNCNGWVFVSPLIFTVVPNVGSYDVVAGEAVARYSAMFRKSSSVIFPSSLTDGGGATFELLFPESGLRDNSVTFLLRRAIVVTQESASIGFSGPSVENKCVYPARNETLWTVWSDSEFEYYKFVLPWGDFRVSCGVSHSENDIYDVYSSRLTVRNMNNNGVQNGFPSRSYERFYFDLSVQFPKYVMEVSLEVSQGSLSDFFDIYVLEKRFDREEYSGWVEFATRSTFPNYMALPENIEYDQDSVSDFLQLLDDEEYPTEVLGEFYPNSPQYFIDYLLRVSEESVLESLPLQTMNSGSFSCDSGLVNCFQTFKFHFSVVNDYRICSVPETTFPLSFLSVCELNNVDDGSCISPSEVVSFNLVVSLSNLCDGEFVEEIESTLSFRLYSSWDYMDDVTDEVFNVGDWIYAAVQVFSPEVTIEGIQFEQISIAEFGKVPRELYSSAEGLSEIGEAAKLIIEDPENIKKELGTLLLDDTAFAAGFHLRVVNKFVDLAPSESATYGLKVIMSVFYVGNEEAVLYERRDLEFRQYSVTGEVNIVIRKDISVVDNTVTIVIVVSTVAGFAFIACLAALLAFLMIVVIRKRMNDKCLMEIAKIERNGVIN